MKINPEMLALILRTSKQKIKIIAKQSTNSSSKQIMVINCETRKYDIIYSYESCDDYETLIQDLGKKSMKQLKEQLDKMGFIWTNSKE